MSNYILEKSNDFNNLLAHEIVCTKVRLSAGAEAPELVLAAELLPVQGGVGAAEEVVDPRVGDLALVLLGVSRLGALPLALDTFNGGLDPQDGAVGTTYAQLVAQLCPLKNLPLSDLDCIRCPRSPCGRAEARPPSRPAPRPR